MRNKLYLLLVLLVGIVQVGMAQEKTITGVVTDADDGSPLPGVCKNSCGIMDCFFFHPPPEHFGAFLPTEYSKRIGGKHCRRCCLDAARRRTR